MSQWNPDQESILDYLDRAETANGNGHHPQNGAVKSPVVPVAASNGANGYQRSLRDDIRHIATHSPRRVYSLLGVEIKRQSGKELLACCIFHPTPDQDPSLNINANDGLWTCRSCDAKGDVFHFAALKWGLDVKLNFPEVCRRLGDLLGISGNGNGRTQIVHLANTTTADDKPQRKLLRTLRHENRDLEGKLLAVHLRHEYDDGWKSMPWETVPGGPNPIKPTELPLYGINRTVEAQPGDKLIVTEGEKKSDSLWDRGHLAVGTVTGAKQSGGDVPCDDSLKPLLPLAVYLWPDNDDNGRSHMSRIGARLLELGAADVRLIQWKDAPHKGDAADFTGDIDALLEAAVPITAPFPYQHLNGNGHVPAVQNGNQPAVSQAKSLPTP